MIGWLKVEEASGVAEARRRTRRTANALGFDSTKVEHAAIVATEIAQNVLRHGGGGKMLVEVFGAPSLERMHILGLDNGAGMDRVDRMLKDGETSKKSMGTGLGAIKRLSDRMDIDSNSGGTVVSAEFRRQTVRQSNPIDQAGLRLAYPGERRCGDAVAVRSSHDTSLYFVCDGLGHGVKAALAADTAKRAFMDAKGSDPGDLLVQIAQKVTGTRGVVAAIVSLDRNSGQMLYAGIGNISTLVLQDRKVQRLAVRDGLLGGRPTTPHVETIAMGSDAVVIMHSDGLATLRGIGERTALLHRSAPVIAARLLAGANRKSDDSSIIVTRMTPARSL